MSGTRSPSPKAPATEGRAIVVSHGQPSDPDPAEATLAAFTSQVAAGLPGWSVSSATLAKPGALDRAFEEVGRGALIYPMFMTAGWFTSKALQRRLAERHAHVLAPFGRDPGLPDLAQQRLSGVLQDKGWTPGDTRLFIAAHGSGRSRQSAEDTQAFAAALSDRAGFAEIRVGFVEEAPYLADMAFDLGDKSICLPFFAAAGGHVLEDVPEVLELAQFAGVLLEPIGCAPDAPALVARALKQAEVPA